MNTDSSSPAIAFTHEPSWVQFDPDTCTLRYPAEDGRARGIRLEGSQDPAPIQAAQLLAKIRGGGLDVGRMHPAYAMTPATRAAAERLLERLAARAQFH